jgi:hypothetical protein
MCVDWYDVIVCARVGSARWAGSADQLSEARRSGHPERSDCNVDRHFVYARRSIQINETLCILCSAGDSEELGTVYLRLRAGLAV